MQTECDTSSDDIMVPAIHVTKTNDITTVIQASSKFPSFRSLPQRPASVDSSQMPSQSGASDGSSFQLNEIVFNYFKRILFCPIDAKLNFVDIFYDM